MGKIVSLISGVWKTGQPYTCKIVKLAHCITPFTKTAKWIEDLHLRPKTIKLLIDNISIKLFDTGLGYIYIYIYTHIHTYTYTFIYVQTYIFNLTPKVKETKIK